MLENNSQATFVEVSALNVFLSFAPMLYQLRMDSAMAMILVNKLSCCQLNMGLPLNTYHAYVDLVSLMKAIHKHLGLEEYSTAPPSTELENIAIVGQVVLPRSWISWQQVEILTWIMFNCIGVSILYMMEPKYEWIDKV